MIVFRAKLDKWLFGNQAFLSSIVLNRRKKCYLNKLSEEPFFLSFSFRVKTDGLSYENTTTITLLQNIAVKVWKDSVPEFTFEQWQTKRTRFQRNWVTAVTREFIACPIDRMSHSLSLCNAVACIVRCNCYATVCHVDDHADEDNEHPLSAKSRESIRQFQDRRQF